VCETSAQQAVINNPTDNRTSAEKPQNSRAGNWGLVLVSGLIFGIAPVIAMVKFDLGLWSLAIAALAFVLFIDNRGLRYNSAQKIVATALGFVVIFSSPHIMSFHQKPNFYPGDIIEVDVTQTTNGKEDENVAQCPIGMNGSVSCDIALLEPWLRSKVSSERIECHLEGSAKGDAEDLIRKALGAYTDIERMRVRIKQSGRDIFSVVSHGDYETLSKLLKSNPEFVSIKDADFYSGTLLHLAANKGLTRIVELLLASGANVNAGNAGHLTPLHFAANAEVAELLVAKGAEINARDNWGRTPLKCQEVDGSSAVVAFLRQHGAQE
jgi:hypothetical protein